MTNTLITFGDSWPAGSENSNNTPTLGHWCAQQLDMQFRNYAVPSTGVPHMLIQLDQAIKDNGTDFTALFCLSSATRSWYYDDDHSPNLGWKEIHVSGIEDPAVDAYYRYLYTDELAQMNFAINILALQKICAAHNIQDYYVSCWSTVEQFSLPGINAQRIHPITMCDMIAARQNYRLDVNIESDSEYVRPNQNHPNAHGHKHIGTTIAEWIQNDTRT